MPGTNSGTYSAIRRAAVSAAPMASWSRSAPPSAAYRSANVAYSTRARSSSSSSSPASALVAAAHASTSAAVGSCRPVSIFETYGCAHPSPRRSANCAPVTPVAWRSSRRRPASASRARWVRPAKGHSWSGRALGGGVVGDRDRLGERRISPLAVLTQHDRIVDEHGCLKGARDVIIHEPQMLVVEQPVVVAWHARRPYATPDGNHPHVLAGLDAPRVRCQLIADVVTERLFDDVHAREPAARGDMLTDHRLPRPRRSIDRLAAQERCVPVALVLRVITLERFETKPRYPHPEEQPLERRIAPPDDALAHQSCPRSSRYTSTARTIVSAGRRTAVSSVSTSCSSHEVSRSRRLPCTTMTAGLSSAT